MDAFSDTPATAANPQRRVWIGCSGYAYKHWRGVFYPQKLPTTHRLEHYVKFFPTVELNNTFYTMPGEPTFHAWREGSPEGFLYFNNDPEGWAVRNALDLTRLVNEAGLPA
ncbi:MAG: DUF72 domain-containing protein [Chloroflexota bacterium]|nr:DUF72 domain-containing protein [Chloroflexota bacterium]